jgi:hypothetical protein
MMLISHVLTCIKSSLFTNLPLVTVYKLTIQKLLFLKYLTLFSSKYLVYLTLSSVEDRKFVLYDFSQNIISSGWTLMFTFVQRIRSCIGTYESSLLFDDNYHCFSKWVAEVFKHESLTELGHPTRQW